MVPGCFVPPILRPEKAADRFCDMAVLFAGGYACSRALDGATGHREFGGVGGGVSGVSRW